MVRPFFALAGLRMADAATAPDDDVMIALAALAGDTVADGAVADTPPPQ